MIYEFEMIGDIVGKARPRMNTRTGFDIPKSTSKKKEAEMLKENISPTKKPDIDNIIKIILDAMNKFAFKDDTQVTKLEIEKKYDKTPRIYIKNVSIKIRVAIKGLRQ